MVLVKTSKNQLQRTGLTVTLEGRVVNANTGLGTVPAGKIWRVVQITGVLDAVGADALYAVAIKRGASFRPVGGRVATDGLSQMSGQLLLQAGDIITNVGDAGSTNGTMDMTCTFQEYDA